MPSGVRTSLPAPDLTSLTARSPGPGGSSSRSARWSEVGTQGEQRALRLQPFVAQLRELVRDTSLARLILLRKLRLQCTSGQLTE